MTRLGDQIGVEDLVGHTRMSARTFHREFTAAAGETPGRWLRGQGIRYARRLIEATELPVERVARKSGLGTAANLRRRLRPRSASARILSAHPSGNRGNVCELWPSTSTSS